MGDSGGGVARGVEQKCTSTVQVSTSSIDFEGLCRAPSKRA